MHSICLALVLSSPHNKLNYGSLTLSSPHRHSLGTAPRPRKPTKPAPSPTATPPSPAPRGGQGKPAAWVLSRCAGIGRVIVGQKYLIDRLLIALIANGHVLLEGVPGLAKTLALRTLAAAVQVRSQRIQFTPDMLPADIVGTQIYTRATAPSTRSSVRSSPISSWPMNQPRARQGAERCSWSDAGPGRSPSAKTPMVLPEPFLVMAIQTRSNRKAPIPCPKAQVDRFMLKIVVTYPARAEERGILDLMATTRRTFSCSGRDGPEQILQSRRSST